MFISALTHLSSDLFLFSEKKIMQLFCLLFLFCGFAPDARNFPCDSVCCVLDNWNVDYSV